jgi:serine/threonine protein kinase
MRFLSCLAGAVLKHGLRALAGVVPFGEVVIDVATAAWESYRERRRDGEPHADPATEPVQATLSAEIVALAQAPGATVQQAVVEAIQDAAAEQAPAVQQALATYLTQVPAMIRRSLRRPSDPTGKTLAPSMSFRKPEDLLPLLPPKLPRFKSGDRPLPGVDWELEELLGVGGFGEVWKARHPIYPGLVAALKFCLDTQAAKSLRNEASKLSRVMQHGNQSGIVRLRQVFLNADPPCLEYDYIEGGDLGSLIRELHERGPVNPELVGRCIMHLTSRVCFAHRLQPPLVHRDLKPANILVQRGANNAITMFIADFGISDVAASLAIGDGASGVTSRSEYLATSLRGAFTPLYASPQQMRGEPADCRDDVYALGVIWYQMLTGDLSSGRPGGRSWRKQLAGRGMASELMDLLESCVDDDPDERPADAVRLLERLGGLLNPKPSPPVPIPPRAERQPAPPPPPRRDSAASPPFTPDAFADVNKPTSFYLGLEYDLAARGVSDKVVDYESKDLTTHGVVVGMTGSGKTGLCIALLEEAAIDGIPCIIIDPKGDLSNLLLQFPNLAPEDFRKWLNEEEAEQKRVSPDDYAKQLSERWKQGLRETGQTEKRIVQLRERSEYRIYTPGSEAGLPLSILQNFKAPRGNILREDLNQKIDATAGALLGLTGMNAGPQSRANALIAQILLHFWKDNKDLDLEQLIGQIQNPPMSKVGALDVETFYKEKDRVKLAVALNNILAAPSFSTWLHGDPLDLSTLLAGGGKTRQLIFSVAHLDDAQRMFFITLLLSEVLSWTRKQSGSTSLRAILYFDEVFGYLPPHPGNPPTKQPLMTLLKQGQGAGLGVLLATRNVTDIDRNALSNIGTWFVGKVQMERDKARLLEGLQGVAAERGARADKAYLEKSIAALGNRLFLLHNIHRGGEPPVFQTRWALSYLRGPMRRDEIARLMDAVKQGQEPAATTGHAHRAPRRRADRGSGGGAARSTHLGRAASAGRQAGAAQRFGAGDADLCGAGGSRGGCGAVLPAGQATQPRRGGTRLPASCPRLQQRHRRGQEDGPQVLAHPLPARRRTGRGTGYRLG